MHRYAIFLLFAIATGVAAPKTATAPVPALSAEWMAALDAISPQSMKGHLSFLASDLLEGRNTPSPGLDIAAEYIAAQFRRVGLEPLTQDSYFQTAQLDQDGRKTPVRNVAGILRGSDPELRNTYIVISAHYDHIGVLPTGSGDRVNNGANDDGSGTVSVIEIAAALAKSPRHPRRSILFVTFYGEEEGFLGSDYFVHHPPVPLDSIVAQINLEQVGRTDDLKGPQVGKAHVTGIGYSEVGSTLRQAGLATNVKVSGDGEDPDDYFDRSDNLPFAEAGIPAHSVGVAFEFPDYHKPGDEWQKIDYANMARIDRMVTAAAILIAENPVAPAWKPRAPKRFRNHMPAPDHSPRNTSSGF